ncbi:MAG TPA: DinB family protein [Anaerolineales bacterium]|nr:DinB family protein [Anaerolineales bacterium]
MTLLLFDLDDTLLGNEMNSFIPAYLQALAKRMSQVAAPDHLVKTLLSATRQMVENVDPGQTLEAKFDAAFYPNLGVSRPEVQGMIDQFYDEDFPQLRRLTQFKPEAAGIVHQILQRGDQVAIATNPLFPQTAIWQRLNWAGLPVNEVPFALVSSYETFHFAKPNPAFFAEFLAQMGWPKVPVVMVGNDVESDIRAARKLSIPVFWLTSDGSSAWDGQGEVPPNGDLSDLLPFLVDAEPGRLPSSYTSPEALLPVLRSTPAALASLCMQKPKNISRRPATEEWSPGEVFCHLRDVDLEVNLWRLKKVLVEKNPFLPGQDTDPWADARHYETQDGMQALVDFTNARKQVLKLLENLPDNDWNHPARHAIFGPTTLRELVNIIAGHDILHVQQVFRAL